MTLVDTHAHLDFPEFEGEIGAILDRAESAGVRRVISVGTSVEGSRRTVELAEKHGPIWAVIGVHPGSVSEAGPDAIRELRDLASHPKVLAVGETGIDRFHLPGKRLLAERGENPESLAEAARLDAAEVALQASVFRAQLALADELGLNVVIHQRAAWAETWAILQKWQGRVRAVFHCFSGGIAEARQATDAGHLVSFTGIATFKNARELHRVVASVPGGSFMVETDCPYLAPVPFRGKRCEPAHVRLTAERIAAERGETLESVADKTTAAASAFFVRSRPACSGGL